MKKLTVLLVIALCLTICGCPAAEPAEGTATDATPVDTTPVGPVAVHIRAGGLQPGMTVQDVEVEVTVDGQPVTCRLALTALTDEGIYTMAEDEKLPESFQVRLDIYYSLPQGRTLDDLQETVEAGGGEYDGTGSAGNDENGCEQVWSHIIYSAQKQTQTDPQPHTHNWQEKSVSKATCTADGLITYTCTCGETKQETVSATGHEQKVDTTVDPTCTKNGRQTLSCIHCGDIFLMELPATGHKWSAWEKATGLVHKHICEYCGAEETAKHNIPSGGVTCTDCGADIVN